MSPRSCPGPTLVSTASFNALAATAGAEYGTELDCTVTLYNPDGWVVDITFASVDTEEFFDCAWLRRLRGCGGRGWRISL